MRTRFRGWLTALAFLLTFFGINTPSALSTRVNAVQEHIKTRAEMKHTLAPGIRVLTIGSSVAAGWGDPNGGGYLARAFRKLSVSQSDHYQIISWAVPGITSTQIAPHYPHWLAFVHPQIVVISWGGLDDAANHTPLATFSSEIHQEISLALQAGAQVAVVTPPVTQAVYLDGKQGLPYQYFKAEMQVARSFASPHVFIDDVYDQMVQYMAVHHDSIQPYVDNSWHPNALGHRLGGQLLFSDLTHQVNRLGQSVTAVKTTSAN